MKIHSTAIIEDGAKLGRGVEIGAYAYIGSEVEIGEGCIISHHASVEGYTIMGRCNQVFPYAYIGGKTHDLKYKGGKTGLRIGDNNVFREYVTVHLATNDGEFTVVGNGNNVLAYSHIAHDCIVHDGIVISSHAALGGHVEVFDRAVIGWGSGVHQFCRVGEYAMLSASSKAVKDIPPFMMADGSPAEVCSFNKVNMQRNEFSEDEINEAFTALKTIYMKGLNRKVAIEELGNRYGNSSRVISMILGFVKDSQVRGF